MISSDTILAALQQLVRFVGRERTGGYRTAMTSSFSRRAESETPTEQAPAEIRGQLEHGEVDAVLTQGVRGRHPAPAFPRHPDRRLLAQPGRALLRRPDRKAAPARGPSRNPGIRTGYPRRYRHRQRQPLSLDQVGRRHPRHHQTLLSAHPGYRRTPKENQQNLEIRTLPTVPVLPRPHRQLRTSCGVRWVIVKHPVPFPFKMVFAGV